MFSVKKRLNQLDVTFTSYTTTNIYGEVTVKEPPYRLAKLFFDVVNMFDLISSNDAYESFELYYKHEDDEIGKTLDLKDYDFSDTDLSNWYGGGANDYVGDWIGYFATGTATTTAAYTSDTDDLLGKTIKVTIKVKEGYVTENGEYPMDYYLNF